jgi:hypothetical protein
MTQREIDRQLVKEMFYFAPAVYTGQSLKHQNVYDYKGKHYIERYRKCQSYMSSLEFHDLIFSMNIQQMEDNYYPLRVRKKYYFEW